MNQTSVPSRRRQIKRSEQLFALGDRINAYQDKHQCSIKAACMQFQDEQDFGLDALYHAQKTARAFTSEMRNPNASFTVHSALADVSRKHFPKATEQQWKTALCKALEVAILRNIKVNDLNNNGKAKPLMEEAFRMLKVL